MLNKKEILLIIILSLIFALAISLVQTVEIFIYTLIAIFLIITINIIAKKIMSYYLDSEIEIKLWQIKQYGFKPKQHFKKPFPAGAFFPIFSKLIFFPINGLIWMASIVFDVKPKVYRAAKRFGLYSFSEITESHLGFIASAGIIANIIFAVIGYFLGFQEFARLSSFYVFFNMLPISNLDGNKIFFGNKILWSFLASLVLIGLIFALFVV